MSTPKGYRDVYWCWVLNEPMIVSFRRENGTAKLHCRNCDFVGDSEEPDGLFLSLHTFICHIEKPRKA